MFILILPVEIEFHFIADYQFVATGRNLGNRRGRVIVGISYEDILEFSPYHSAYSIAITISDSESQELFKCRPHCYLGRKVIEIGLHHQGWLQFK